MNLDNYLNLVVVRNKHSQSVSFEQAKATMSYVNSIRTIYKDIEAFGVEETAEKNGISLHQIKRVNHNIRMLNTGARCEIFDLEIPLDEMQYGMGNSYKELINIID